MAHLPIFTPGAPGVVPSGFQGQLAHRWDASTKDQHLSTDVLHSLRLYQTYTWWGVNLHSLSCSWDP